MLKFCACNKDSPLDSSTARNTKESPLLRLPAELRSRIYSYVLGGLEIDTMRSGTRDRPIMIPRERTENDERRSLHDWVNARYAPTDTLLSCRQINSEARLLPFSLNHFKLCRYPAFGALLDALKPAQRNAISTVRVFGVELNRRLGNHDYAGYGACDVDASPQYDPPLGRLLGLKKVVWTYDDDGSEEEERERCPEDMIRYIVCLWDGPADVEISYEAYS